MQPLLQWTSNRYCLFLSVCLRPYEFSMQCPCTVSSCVACPVEQYFPHYLINGTIFEKKIIEHKMCGLIFSASLSQTFIILSRTERVMITNVITLHVKYPLFLSDFKETSILSTDFRKTLKYKIS